MIWRSLQRLTPTNWRNRLRVLIQKKMTVVFSTYHSIDVIHRSQFEHDSPEFDLIICDEAHRTTGATLSGDDESNFVRIHDNENVKGKKRLYMTATPRIFGETAKQKAEDGEVALASMDDEATFGKVLFHRGFGWAVENNWLTDYKVIVLAVDESLVSQRAQTSLSEGLELKLDDATKMIGCYKALAKIGLKPNPTGDDEAKVQPMQRALAFCQNIASSKIFAAEFANVVSDYSENERIEEKYKTELEVEIQHVDGTFNADLRNERLQWLKDDTDENQCRVLTNVRCLSEGVDVPSLDAIMFLHPRKSQIDVVQSVGRVMRKSDEKDMGYVIIPITVASGITPEKALNDNERYKVVWQILNALRTHDERFDSTINRIGLGEDVSDRIEIIGVGSQEELDATTAVVEDVKPKPKPKKETEKEDIIGTDEAEDDAKDEPEQMSFVLSDLSQAIKAKIVQKCGTRDYWENWANDIADIAQQHIVRINAVIVNSGTPERAAFDSFLEEIRDDLNPEITESDAVEMLAQHLITKPVFDTLFVGNQFTSENAVSKAMEKVLDYLHAASIDTESHSLEKFYDSVKRRAADIVTSIGRQTLILELYDRFFRNAFPRLTQRLGIVYTPTEVVDFIVHSVNDVLQEEFGKSLGSKGVHILDPFTGTGTFITRLMQSGLISKEELKNKYKDEIHANEVVLLAYYIAAINIESIYQDIAQESQYRAFTGMVLTDTFQLYEQDKDVIARLLPDNSERRSKQKEQVITVIVGNPPYSAGQTSANDNAANVAYLNLDQQIEKTYADASSATNKNALYDSYIRSFRWASDRIGEEGIIGFVSNAGWIEGNATDGMRKCLSEEFSKLYIFHLRGNARTSGELRRREKGNVFGEGTRTPVAITILVKNKESQDNGQIFFHDIGDYLDQKQKLAIVRSFKSINGITKQDKFRQLEPDDDNDWVNQGDRRYKEFLPIAVKNRTPKGLFQFYKNGVQTNRDTWAQNCSKFHLEENIKRMLDTYQSQVERHKKFSGKFSDFRNTVENQPSKIKWTRGLIKSLEKNTDISLSKDEIRTVLYRPFFKQNIYLSKGLVEYLNGWDNWTRNSVNRTIVFTGANEGKTSVLMTDSIPDVQILFNCQCASLRIPDPIKVSSDLFRIEDSSKGTYERSGLTDEAQSLFRNAYPDEQFTKEDMFYYIYGILHSPDYRERFKNNLSKELPRIPAVSSFEDFMSFSLAGRELGDLHINYESVEPYPVSFKQGDLRLSVITDPKSFYRVEKMKFPKKTDKTVVFYNNNITIENIPIEAYEYVVNGKPALEWVMERQCVKKDKASGIVNDANDYANETMNNPAYPLELFQRVITVSIETMKIVGALPSLEID